MNRKLINWVMIIISVILLAFTISWGMGEVALAGKYQPVRIDFNQSDVNSLISIGFTERVSVSSDGEQGNNFSGYPPSISGDGRFVAFASLANNLVPGDTNDTSDVFVHDRMTGQTELVSVASDGSQGNGRSSDPSISAEGRYVAFWSEANNLVSQDTNNVGDIFVIDRVTRQTQRISEASDGSEGNGRSTAPNISADGRYVTFASYATNLIIDILTVEQGIFVHDRLTDEIELASVASDGTHGNRGSRWSSISADGRYVAFMSEASNLVADDTNGTDDIFVHDRMTGQTERVSVGENGIEGNDQSRRRPTISKNGRFVAFTSLCSNLVSNDTNEKADIFVHDRDTDQTERVSIASDGSQGNSGSAFSSISDDGRFVTFDSLASNLVSGDTNRDWDIFVHDRQTGMTYLVSMASNRIHGNNESMYPWISADGQSVVFASLADNLVSGDTNSHMDVFVHEWTYARITYLPVVARQ